ncbi:hypothetical protein HYW82_00915 [Candidatus Peregrinibacteria bacterium]|nr:hypothetical protein [Candidatus Peregrinibacteria bacterium]
MALGYVDNDNFEIFPHLIVAGILGTILSVIASYIHYKNMISKLEEIYKSKDKEYYADID